jgi:mono/diheme cytochrome c family protein
MTRAGLAMLVGALLLAGCGGGQKIAQVITRTVTRSVTVTANGVVVGVNINGPGGTGPKVIATSHPNAPDVRAPAGLQGQALAQYDLGEQVAGESGCLGCHVIGRDGNNGPGPNLTAVGARLTRVELTRALVHPRAPMPSFAALPHRTLTALVAFLSALG